MDKKRAKICLTITLIVSLLLLASCGKKECTTSSDCGLKTCFNSKCDSGKCSWAIQRNCCGNRLKETQENGKTGNQCSCPDDYGKCEGATKIKIGSRTEDSRYLKLACNEEEKCVLSVDPKDIQPQNFLDSISTGFFKASIVSSLNKPFDLLKDTITLKVTLDDATKEVSLPVQFIKIKVLYTGETSRNEQLIAEKQIDIQFAQIGDEATIVVPLNLNYKPQQAEESGSIRFSIDYSLVRKISAGKNDDGTPKYSDEIQRGSYNSPTKAFFLVKTG